LNLCLLAEFIDGACCLSKAPQATLHAHSNTSIAQRDPLRETPSTGRKYESPQCSATASAGRAIKLFWVQAMQFGSTVL
jgi:hypothetical protein